MERQSAFFHAASGHGRSDQAHDSDGGGVSGLGIVFATLIRYGHPADLAERYTLRQVSLYYDQCGRLAAELLHGMAQAACVPYTKKPGDALKQLSELVHGERD